MPEREWGDSDLLRLDAMDGQVPDARRHLDSCTFGPGFYRISYASEGLHQDRYFQDQEQAESFRRLLLPSANVRAYRDACLDAPALAGGSRTLGSDALTPDVVDGEWWLTLPQRQAMDELGLTTEAEYRRVARAVEGVLATRDNRRAQGGIHAPVVLKRRRSNPVEPDLPKHTLKTFRLTGYVPPWMLPVRDA